jgi:hypothetical protein
MSCTHLLCSKMKQPNLELKTLEARVEGLLYLFFNLAKQLNLDLKTLESTVHMSCTHLLCSKKV